MACQFMREHNDQYSVRETAAHFGASTSLYYKMAKRGPSKRRIVGGGGGSNSFGRS
jgi:hypothetical protein